MATKQPIPFHWRDAREEDFVAITDIYNQVMRDSLSMYQEQEVTVESRIDWWKDRLKNNFPFIVGTETTPEGKEEVICWATYGPFRAAYGYRFTVEHSVYVRQDKRGRGLGNRLLEKILDIAKERGIHVMVAGIDSGNLNSIAMHEKYGFEEVARMPQVGCKKGQSTLVLMQKLLS
jgi:L-amino acid N-acyltransferase YncA